MQIESSDFVEAAEDGDLGEVRRLLAVRGRVVLLDTIDLGMTALHRAAQFGHAEVVQELLMVGMSPSVRDDRKRTPLHDAVSHIGSLFCLHVLVRSGALIEGCDVYGNTPLMEAASNSNVAAVVYLLDRGANPQKINRRGMTPLDLAEYQLEGFGYGVDPKHKEHAVDLMNIKLFLADATSRRLRTD